MSKPNTQNEHHEFKGLNDWVEIFQAGEQTDSKGRKSVWTHEHLDQMVANHSAAHPVPHTITHKKLFSPFAYAQGTELKREGDSLYVKSDNVEPAFEKLITEGRLYTRSIGIDKDKKTGEFKVDHIAWLGAEPPAIDGLAPVEFSSGDDVLHFSTDFSQSSEADYKWGIVGDIFRNLRDSFIEQFDLKTADRLIPDYLIDSVNRQETESGSLYQRNDKNNKHDPRSSMQGHPLLTTGESTVSQEEKKEFTQADIDAALAKQKGVSDSEFKAAQDKLEKVEHDARVAKFQKIVDDAVFNKKTLLPAQAEGMAEFMASQLNDTGQTFEFSRGDGDTIEQVKKTQEQWFGDFLASFSKSHNLTTKTDAGDDLGGGELHQFQARDGSVVNADQDEIYSKAVEFQRANGGEFIDAYKAVGGQ